VNATKESEVNALRYCKNADAVVHVTRVDASGSVVMNLCLVCETTLNALNVNEPRGVDLGQFLKVLKRDNPN
jgi:hypothetical protein